MNIFSRISQITDLKETIINRIDRKGLTSHCITNKAQKGKIGEITFLLLRLFSSY